MIQILLGVAGIFAKIVAGEILNCTVGYNLVMEIEFLDDPFNPYINRKSLGKT